MDEIDKIIENKIDEATSEVAEAALDLIENVSEEIEQKLDALTNSSVVDVSEKTLNDEIGLNRIESAIEAIAQKIDLLEQRVDKPEQVEVIPKVEESTEEQIPEIIDVQEADEVPPHADTHILFAPASSIGERFRRWLNS